MTTLAVAGTSLVGTAVTARAAAPPDGRAYERVSPQDTNSAAAVGPFGATSELIVDDDDVLFGGGVVPSSDTPSGAGVVRLAHRTSAGWSVTSFGPTSGIPPYQTERLVDATRTLSGAVFSSASTLNEFVPSQVAAGQLMYRDAAGRFSTIVTDADPTDTSDPSSYDVSQYGGMAADGQTVVYSSDTSPAGLPDADGLRQVYVWHPGGAVTRVPDGDDEAVDCGSEVAGYSDQTVASTPDPIAQPTNAVSSDGSTVFISSGHPFSASDCAPTQLYVSRAGQTTRISSPLPGVTQTTPASVAFVGASPDGRSAFFVTSEALTGDAPDGTREMYEWRADPGTGTALTCLSCAAPSLAEGTGTAGVSPSGQYAYFQAQASGGRDTLWAEHDGVTRQVAQLGREVAALSSNDLGDVVVTQTAGIVETGPNTGDPLNTVTRVSIGSSDAQSECLACTPDGTPVNSLLANGAPTAPQANRSEATLSGYSQFVSDDGSEVVFTSSAALTPDAVDGVAQLYRWSAGSGLALVAPAATLPEISPDGSNIVFQSSRQLTDDTTQAGTQTLYDARIGGGFPAVPSSTPCAGDGCRGVAPTPPEPPPVGSSGRTSGNVSPPGHRLELLTPRRLSTSQRRQLAAGASVRLTVPVRGSGRVTVTLTASVRGHRMTLAHGAARARGRDVVVRLTLSRDARRTLAAHRTLRATVAITAPGARRRTFAVTLTQRSGS